MHLDPAPDRDHVPAGVSPASSQVTDSPIVLDEVVTHRQGKTLAQLAKHLPATRGGGTASASCLWRWATAGKTTPDGRLVKLEVVRLGCRLISTPQALKRFLLALQPRPVVAFTPGSPPQGEPTRPSARGHQKAVRRLGDAGLC